MYFYTLRGISRWIQLLFNINIDDNVDKSI